MDSFKLLIASLSIFSIVVVGCSKDKSEITPIESDDPITQIPLEERLQSIIDAKIGIDDDKLVGVSVSIRVNGVERWALVGGISDVDLPITSHMKFGVGSITKTAIAATILKLEEEGLLTLEDTIGDHISLNAQNVNESITLIQLLSHFSGLGSLFGSSLWNRVEGDLDSAIPPLELVDYIAAPINDPGIAHQYSNSNYLLLALIIEAVTQQTVGQAMRQRFWIPLNLNNIYFGGNEAIMNPIAAAWRDSNGDGILENISAEYRAAYHSVFYGPAGIFGTASDLSLWVYYLVHGGALSELSKTKMLTVYGEIPHPIFTGYGLGMRRNIYSGTVMWGHTGGVRGYGAHMFHDPIGNISMAVVNNQSRSVNGPQLRHELFNELMTEILLDN